MTQPEAIRLADALEATDQMHSNADLTSVEVATELRRLHDLLGKANALARIRAERITDLLAALGGCLSVLEKLGHEDNHQVEKARAAIAKATGEQA